jgi:hypothetical protein
MKLASLFATTAIATMVAASTVPVQAFNPSAAQAAPQEVKIAKALTSQEKIDQISPVKGKGASADLMRKLYKEDLTPLGVQVGGAGMVVNLYSKKDDTTISLCTTFDVVVAIKKGLIVQFAPSEVK